MYKLKNGILYENDKPVLGIGVSYYPSFFPTKVPVNQDGDRIGEMKKDIKDMKDNGFNIVRFAARGDIAKKNGSVEIDMDFIDAMMQESDKTDIATMVRLDGYAMNLSGYNDYLMKIQTKEEIDSGVWHYFIQSSLYHEGVMEDTDIGTRALAKHFSRYKNLVVYQTFNEPHYPFNFEKKFSYLCDYHESTIAAYRKWLVEKNILSEDEAKGYEPPVSRHDKSDEEWVNWRLFNMQSLTGFLSNVGKAAKEAYPKAHSMASLTTHPMLAWNAIACVQFSEFTENCDMAGLDVYNSAAGAEYFVLNISLDQLEASAALSGKHAWLVEYNACTKLPKDRFNQEFYSAIGTGLKGLMFYQWRGDMKDTPEADIFGFIYSDRTKSKDFDEKMKTISFFHQNEELIVNAEKYRNGVAILYSDYGYLMADARDNRDNDGQNNSYLRRTYNIYRDLRKTYVSVDFVKAQHLKDNLLGVKALYVPDFDLLSDEEKAQVEAFEEKGGNVFDAKQLYGFVPHNKKTPKFARFIEAQDTLDMAGIKPFAQVLNNQRLMTGVLKGKDYYILTVNNISALDNEMTGAVVKLSEAINNAVFKTPDETINLEIVDNMITLPAVKDGCLIILK